MLRCLSDKMQWIDQQKQTFLWTKNDIKNEMGKKIWPQSSTTHYNNSALHLLSVNISNTDLGDICFLWKMLVKQEDEIINIKQHQDGKKTTYKLNE